MTRTWTVFVAVLLSAAVIPFASQADPPASQPADDDDGAVVVIRGMRTTVYTPPGAANAAKKAGAQPTADEAVIVHRGASGSFMRNTQRLAAEARARDERAAWEEAREANRRLIAELEAQEAARQEAAARPPKKRSRNVAPPSPGAINPATGKFYPNVGGGVIDPQTGQFYPDVGAGYVNPTNGQFVPKN